MSWKKIQYNITKYINIGAVLLDVQKVKENNLWNNYVKNRYLKLEGQPDQTLFNIVVPDDKKNYLPFKFGGYTLFGSDEDYDLFNSINYGFKQWFNSSLSSSLPENPKSEKGILLNLYNPRFIHQFFGKWEKGNGLSIYRLLAKYFIIRAGIGDEICRKKPGYCF